MGKFFWTVASMKSENFNIIMFLKYETLIDGFTNDFSQLIEFQLFLILILFKQVVAWRVRLFHNFTFLPAHICLTCLGLLILIILTTFYKFHSILSLLMYVIIVIQCYSLPMHSTFKNIFFLRAQVINSKHLKY